MNKKLLAHLLVLAANIFYGLNYHIGKIVLKTVSPFTIVFTRVFISFLLFGIIQAIFIKEKLNIKDHLKVFICAVFGVACNQLLFFTGLKNTSQIHASLIMITTPFLVLLIGWILKKEIITHLKFLGVLIGAIGVCILILNNSDQSSSDASVFGDICVMLNAASYAVFLVLAKPLLQKYSPFTITFWIFFYGLLLVLPFSFSGLMIMDWQAISEQTIFAWLYVIFFATFLAYLCNTLGLHYGNASLVSIYIYSQPVIATIVSVISKTEVVTTYKIIAALLICVGVACVTFQRKRKLG